MTSPYRFSPSEVMNMTLEEVYVMTFNDSNASLESRAHALEEYKKILHKRASKEAS